MRCKACDVEFNSYTFEVEVVDGFMSVLEECCAPCVGAAFDMTYEPQGMPRNQEFEMFLQFVENKA